MNLRILIEFTRYLYIYFIRKAGTNYHNLLHPAPLILTKERKHTACILCTKKNDQHIKINDTKSSSNNKNVFILPCQARKYFVTKTPSSFKLTYLAVIFCHLYGTRQICRNWMVTNMQKLRLEKKYSLCRNWQNWTVNPFESID